MHYGGGHSLLQFLVLLTNKGKQVSKQGDMIDSNRRNKLTTLALMDKQTDMEVMGLVCG